MPGTRNVGLPYSPASTRSSGVGGSSRRWRVDTPSGQGFVRLKELDAHDFESRGWSSVPGWPISHSSLLPHYERARELLGLAPEGGRDVPVDDRVDRRVYSFASKDVFTTTLPQVLAQRSNVRLFAGCRVLQLVREPAGRLVSLSCRTSDGGALTVRARAYVLAGGALENARLMLASRASALVGEDLASGVGDEHGHVGRWFMEHPHYFCGVVVPRPGTDLAIRRDVWDVVTRDGTLSQAKYALSAKVQDELGLLNAAFKIKEHRTVGLLGFGQDGRVPQHVVDDFHRLGAAARSRDLQKILHSTLPFDVRTWPHLARYGARRLDVGVRTLTGRSQPVRDGYRLVAMAEQEPTRASGLRLVADRDEFGVPMAELDWRLSPVDIRSMVMGQRVMAPTLERAVGGHVVLTLGPGGPPSPAGGAHHMGTTRMSATPQHGVVDAECRVHGVPNLWVAGSSVFPRGGAANPTLTIVALALRLAGRIENELRPAGSTVRTT